MGITPDGSGDHLFRGNLPGGIGGMTPSGPDGMIPVAFGGMTPGGPDDMFGGMTPGGPGDMFAGITPGGSDGMTPGGSNYITIGHQDSSIENLPRFGPP